jgi:hypothetical protein
MKVSRKVGRRSRKYNSSSISRRRLRIKKSYKKNSYRKKNAKTQKGGKRGRGYKRMRAHTHKRGRRFHGGKPGDKLSWLEKMTYPEPEWEFQEQQNILRKKRQDYSTITDPSQLKDQKNGGKLETRSYYGSKNMWLVTHDPTLDNDDSSNYRSPVITLKCQKKTGGYFPAKPQKFSCYISYHYNTQENEIRVYVSFTREDNDDIVFQFIGTPENVANQLKNLNGLSQVTAKKGPSALDNGEVYSFNFPNENKAMFDAIADAIKFYEGDAEVSVTTTSQNEQLQKKKEQQQQQQQQQPGESSSEAVGAALSNDTLLPPAAAGLNTTDDSGSGISSAKHDGEAFEMQRLDYAEANAASAAPAGNSGSNIAGDDR